MAMMQREIQQCPYRRAQSPTPRAAAAQAWWAAPPQSAGAASAPDGQRAVGGAGATEGCQRGRMVGRRPGTGARATAAAPPLPPAWLQRGCPCRPRPARRCAVASSECAPEFTDWEVHHSQGLCIQVISQVLRHPTPPAATVGHAGRSLPKWCFTACCGPTTFPGRPLERTCCWYRARMRWGAVARVGAAAATAAIHSAGISGGAREPGRPCAAAPLLATALAAAAGHHSLQARAVAVASAQAASGWGVRAVRGRGGGRGEGGRDLQAHVHEGEGEGEVGGEPGVVQRLPQGGPPPRVRRQQPPQHLCARRAHLPPPPRPACIAAGVNLTAPRCRLVEWTPTSNPAAPAGGASPRRFHFPCQRPWWLWEAWCCLGRTDGACSVQPQQFGCLA